MTKYRDLALVISATLIALMALWVVRDLALADKIASEGVIGLIGTLAGAGGGVAYGRMSGATAPAEPLPVDGDFDTSDMEGV